MPPSQVLEILTILRGISIPQMEDLPDCWFSASPINVSIGNKDGEVMAVGLRNSPLPEAETAKLTLLIVDDDPENRQVVRRVIERATFEAPGGLNVAEGADGEEAIRLARELHPEIVLMDIAMPRLNGLEATRRIKAEQPDTKVVILTVHDERAYREAAVAMDADAFLAKKTLGTSLVPTITTLTQRTGLQLKRNTGS